MASFPIEEWLHFLSKNVDFLLKNVDFINANEKAYLDDPAHALVVGGSRRALSTCIQVQSTTISVLSQLVWTCGLDLKYNACPNQAQSRQNTCSLGLFWAYFVRVHMFFGFYSGDLPRSSLVSPHVSPLGPSLGGLFRCNVIRGLFRRSGRWGSALLRRVRLPW